ncbi:MAG: hypothetical protein DHS20C17_01690 [Cyclobacteriaceae bacterium]|nr:MAG: hypothetical protein DHS20C17_01690 [Cyclobacteriaceae bacterium]
MEPVAVTAILIIIAGILAIKISKRKSMYPLLPKRYNFGKRRDTLKKVLEMLDAREAKVLLETGISREGLKNTKGDGASTILFGIWAKQHQAKLYSVDIDPKAVSVANKQIDAMDLTDYVFTHVSDSVAYLKLFDQQVGFLYLDSYDYDKRDKSIQKMSQLHHLNEFKAIESRLKDNCVVLIDDCNLPGGGKGKTVIEYMLKRNWEIVMQEYQVILQKSSIE